MLLSIVCFVGIGCPHYYPWKLPGDLDRIIPLCLISMDDVSAHMLTRVAIAPIDCVIIHIACLAVCQLGSIFVPSIVLGRCTNLDLFAAGVAILGGIPRRDEGLDRVDRLGGFGGGGVAIAGSVVCGIGSDIDTDGRSRMGRRGDGESIDSATAIQCSRRPSSHRHVTDIEVCHILRKSKRKRHRIRNPPTIDQSDSRTARCIVCDGKCRLGGIHLSSIF